MSDRSDGAAGVGAFSAKTRATKLNGMHAKYGLLTSVVNSLGTVWTLFLMGLILTDVLGRFLFNSPLVGVPETVAYSIVAIVFLQISNTLYVGRVTQSDLVLSYLDSKAPFAWRFFNVVFALIGLTIFLLIAWGTFPTVVETMERGTFFGNPAVFTVQLWPFYLMIFLGAVLAAVEYAFKAVVFALACVRAEISDAKVGKRDYLMIVGLLTFFAAALLFVATDPSKLAVGLLSIFGIIVLIYAGMPVAITLISISLLGIYSVRSMDLAVKTLALSSTGTITEYIFGVIPLFVLMGLVINVTGVGKDTFDVAQWLVGKLKGGLGIATVLANAIFAAVTGVSIASAAVFTRVATPEMIRYGYSERFAVGVVAGSSVLGMLIPPSLLLIVYAVIAEVSVGSLFLAAVIPGILLACCFIVAIMLMARFAPSFIGSENIDIPEST
ncbi:MAG: TRAP transporter large permease subunit, partial [Pseudomonadota bacterium]